MPHLKYVIVAGRVVEIRKTYSPRYGKKIPRGENSSLTPEAMEKVNEREAEAKLRRIFNANFKGGDFHAVFEYSAQYNPTPEEARKHLEKLLRDMRALYKKRGTVLKYITTTERGQRGRRKLHHHLVVNYMDTRLISALWPWSRVKFFPLDDSGQYAKLAEYLIKRTRVTYKNGDAGYKKRWNSSKNLKTPKVKTYVISAAKWRKEPKAWSGYYIEKDSLFDGVSAVTGYPMQFYSMVKLPVPHRRD